MKPFAREPTATMAWSPGKQAMPTKQEVITDLDAIRTAETNLGPEASRNAGMNEAELDQVIEDSFPASDAPSHTPTTGFGRPADFEAPPIAVTHRKRIALAATVASAIVAIAVGTTLWRRHSRSSGPVGRVLHK